MYTIKLPFHGYNLRSLKKIPVRNEIYNLRNIKRVNYTNFYRDKSIVVKRNYGKGEIKLSKVSSRNKFNKNKYNRLQKKITNSSSWSSILKLRNTSKLPNNKYYVSATKIKNYLINDPVLDYYKLKNKNSNGHRTNFCDSGLNILFEMGNRFEREVINEIKKIYPDKVTRSDKYMNINDHYNTIKYMKEGYPFIEQAGLYDEEIGIFGYADLLVRSDYLNNLVKQKYIENENYKAPNLNNNYHYVVIDIKWSTMDLCANGLNLRNSKLLPAYKGQLAIYNLIVGKNQGYIPDKTFIMAKGWKYTQRGNTYRGYSFNDRLGVIDYSDFDNKYIELVKEAICWIRKVNTKYEKWSLNPPSCPELYPNMNNNYDTPYSKQKYEHAKLIKELTLLPSVSYKHRNTAHGNDVYSFDDKNLCANILGIKGQKTAPFIDKYIKFYRDSIENYSPKNIINNIGDWKNKTGPEFFVDFETLNTMFTQSDMNIYDSSNANEYIFMIGVGYIRDEQFYYKSFIADNISEDTEYSTVRDFIKFIEEETNYYCDNNSLNREDCNVKLYHWSQAEIHMLNSFNERFDHVFSDWNPLWVDLYQVFKSEPVFIRGAQSYSLKDISRAMHKLGYIDTIWESGVADGFSASLLSCKYYKEKNQLSHDSLQYKHLEKVMLDIEKYNLVDCKVLWEILSFIRKN